jgi:hypothetical protein
MGVLGLILSLVAAPFLVIGLIPFLGWLNWFTTLPISVTGAIFSGVGLASRPRSRPAIVGLIISLAVFLVALLRLTLGGGVL